MMFSFSTTLVLILFLVRIASFFSALCCLIFFLCYFSDYKTAIGFIGQEVVNLRELVVLVTVVMMAFAHFISIGTPFIGAFLVLVLFITFAITVEVGNSLWELFLILASPALLTLIINIIRYKIEKS